MTSTKLRSRDLTTLIDHVHEFFESWESRADGVASFDPDTLQRTKLAVHEWLANLIQHAEFDNRVPDIRIEFRPNGQSIQCVIEDNSAGFDLDGQLHIRKNALDVCPERGMGLLMLQACTAGLSYYQTDNDRQCLEFEVSSAQDPWLNIPF
jgi:serine/threonine-protein kinase RsbW